MYLCSGIWILKYIHTYIYTASNQITKKLKTENWSERVKDKLFSNVVIKKWFLKICALSTFWIRTHYNGNEGGLPDGERGGRGESVFWPCCAMFGIPLKIEIAKGLMETWLWGRIYPIANQKGCISKNGFYAYFIRNIFKSLTRWTPLFLKSC